MIKTVRLEELASVRGGKRLPKGVNLITTPNSHPYIRVRDLNNRHTLELNADFEYVDDETQKNIVRYIVDRGDIVLSIVGTIGLVAIVGDSLHHANLTENCVKLTQLNGVNRDYLYYFLKSELGQAEIAKGTVGAVQAKLPIKNIQAIEVVLPSLEQQEKIASILAAIDYKIEANEKINDNLADLLQTVYQEHFGDVISAADQGILSDICSFSKDKVAVSKLDVSTYFSTENMLPGKFGATEATSLPTTPQTTACHEGDTLISNIRPYFKKIVYCEGECGCSTDVLCFTPAQPRYAAYLFSTLYADKFFAFMVAGSKGTKMPRGDKQQIMTYTVALPSDEELEEFNALAFPILMQIHSNRGENKRLSAVRDALLPKLMSGELDVSEVNF